MDWKFQHWVNSLTDAEVYELTAPFATDAEREASLRAAYAKHLAFSASLVPGEDPRDSDPYHGWPALEETG